VEDGRASGEPAIVERDCFVREVAAAVAAGVPVVAFDPPVRLKLEEGLAAQLAVAQPVAGNLLHWWAGRSSGERAAFALVAPQPVYLRPPHVTQAKAGHPLLR